MIELKNISKIYRIRNNYKVVLSDFNFTFSNSKNYAVMGPNGIGKTTLLGIISGAITPTKGKIFRRGKVSWPIGFAKSFNKNMTGIENIKFVARIYDKNPQEIIEYVREFSELGDALKSPVDTYSSGMRARLSFGVCLAIDFQHYIIDEIVAVGDKSFRLKSRAAFKRKIKDASVILASHSTDIVTEYCDCGILIGRKKIKYFDCINSLTDAYNEQFSAQRT